MNLDNWVTFFFSGLFNLLVNVLDFIGRSEKSNTQK
jgi:hypothetical protein